MSAFSSLGVLENPFLPKCTITWEVLENQALLLHYSITPYPLKDMDEGR